MSIGSAPVMSVTADPASNRLVVSGMTYDANGNVTNMPGVGALAYDSRNRIVGTGGVPTRGYDPGNRKIWWKSSSGSTYVDFWLPNGEKLATFLLEETPVYDVNNTYFLGYVQLRATQRELYFAGRRVATQWGNTNSFTWLQPERLSSNARHHPYGEERGTSSTEYKFATYQREASGLDYALNRYYSSVYGRFLSSDPYRASGGPSDPGSWNRYAYTRGDPINRTDPSGLADQDPVFSTSVTGMSDFSLMLVENFVRNNSWHGSLQAWGPPEDTYARAEYFARLTTAAYRSRISTVLLNMSEGCKSAFSNDTSYNHVTSTPLLTAMAQAASTVNVLNGIGGEGQLAVSSGLASGVPSNIPESSNVYQYTLGATGAGASAVVLGNAIYLTRLFHVGSTDRQDTTLIHEMLHVTTRLGDIALAKHLKLPGSDEWTGGDEHVAAASGAITSYIQRDCKP